MNILAEKKLKTYFLKKLKYDNIIISIKQAEYNAFLLTGAKWNIYDILIKDLLIVKKLSKMWIKKNECNTINNI